MFDIITPTYNRMHTLKRVLDSLLAQTETRFHWIITDDGSTDETPQLVARWKREHPELDITYQMMPTNQGKSYAVNHGLQFCKHPFTIIADSDDSFVSNTLSDLRVIWEEIETMEFPERIAAIWTLTKDEKGQLVGDKFPEDYWRVNLEERVLKRTIKGEKWHCWRTDILQKQQLYVAPQCYVMESATWNKINRDYDFLGINKIHRNYYYSPDGIMVKKISKTKRAKTYYYSTLYELMNSPKADILKYKHYHSLAFEHIKARFRFRDKKIKLKLSKLILSFIIFLFVLPKRLFNRLT